MFMRKARGPVPEAKGRKDEKDGKDIKDEEDGSV